MSLCFKLRLTVKTFTYVQLTMKRYGREMTTHKHEGHARLAASKMYFTNENSGRSNYVWSFDVPHGHISRPKSSRYAMYREYRSISAVSRAQLVNRILSDTLFTSLVLLYALQMYQNSLMQMQSSLDQRNTNRFVVMRSHL